MSVYINVLLHEGDNIISSMDRKTIKVITGIILDEVENNNREIRILKF